MSEQSLAFNKNPPLILDDMTLAFQPIVHAKSPREIAYYECLLRLKNAEGYDIEPNLFIEQGEKLGLLQEIDMKVLELVAFQMQKSPHLKFAINISPVSTIDNEWLEAIKNYSLSVPHLFQRIIVEITETTPILDMKATQNFVKSIQTLGGKVAIDDFGTGYTSFENLRELSVDIVKIDGSFITHLLTSKQDEAFVSSVLSEAKRQGLVTIAEWVQSETVAQKLYAMGCDYLQGNYMGAAVAMR